LEFKNIINPVTESPYTDLSGVEMVFTVKKDISDDDPGVAQLTHQSGAVTIVGGTVTVLYLTNAISEMLVAGREYVLDGWLKDAEIVRPFNFGEDEENAVYIAKFATAKSVTVTKP
jgi:hypothetical protein